ncbi:hypothetical protein R1flu_003348 [Riccia fluitans]|uniref:GPI transamidase component PIG-T n=1 Tax=Riccia fluitans TaxID=41844 RepID=A0ABD1Y8R5_9MARC
MATRDQSYSTLLPSLLFLLFSLSLLRISGFETVVEKKEKFSEDLLIRPLSDGKVLSHFYFKNYQLTLGSAAHTHVFPKAISQLVSKFHITELELSFTQGRWNYEHWGGLDPIASLNAKPSGVELWAKFDVPIDQVDPTWRNLTHALSGLFCASINFLESPEGVASPNLVFGSKKKPGSERHYGLVRYGALPREAVCTENLTPWLKLLPCRDKAGIATLLDRPSIYNGHYHSLRVHINRSGPGRAVVLEQTLTLVLQPTHIRERGMKELPHWSLTSLFGRKLEGKCPLALSSHVLLELERSLVENVKASGGKAGEKVTSEGEQVDIADNPVFHVSPDPENVLVESVDSGDASKQPSLMLEYDLQRYSLKQPLNLALLWRRKVAWSSVRGPFRVSRFLIGSGNDKGSIAIEMKRNFNLSLQDGETSAGDFVEVIVFQMVAWYVRLYMHTLMARIDGNPVPLRDITTEMLVTPAEDRLHPAVLEMHLKLPRDINRLCLTIDFDKGFLHIDEHPPDADHGFDLQSAFLSFPRSQTRRLYLNQQAAQGEDHPLIQTLNEPGFLHMYTTLLLVPLATPDKSMPYNVITFTCTILALYFGSLLNTLRRRIGEEERLAKAGSGGKLKKAIAKFMEGKSESQKRLIKLSGVILIAAIGVAVNYVLEQFEVF